MKEYFDYIFMDFIVPLYNTEITNYSLYHVSFSMS